MATIESPSTTPATSIRRLLERLRRRVRAYLWIRAVARVVACAIAVVWVALALDWFFEPAREVRLGLFLLYAGVVGYAIERLWMRQVFVPLTDRSMAIVLERHYPGFQEGLVTSVELDVEPETLAPWTREMLGDTERAAARAAEVIELRRVFNFAPLAASVAAALLLVGSLVAFAVLDPVGFQVGMSRLALGEATWPRKTRLAVAGFKNGEAVVAKGADLKVSVLAATEMVVPDTVEVRYRSEDGVRERKTMIREGNAQAGRDEYQRFQYTFQGVLEPLEFEVRGGDARVRNLRIRVVESPAIATRLYCEFPAYTRMAPRELPVTGSLPLPRGSRIIVRATANKELVSATVEEATPSGHRGEHPARLRSPRQVEYRIDELDTDLTLSFTLLDTDGITNREPIRLSLGATPDTAPQVNVRPKGIGTAITSKARVPLVGDLTDDYGVAKAWIDYTIDATPARQDPLKIPGSVPAEFDVQAALDIVPLKLKPGQKLSLGVKAADDCRMPDHPQPNVGQGERFLLDIVTPEQLRAMLEARELNLRQQFETTITEVIQTRELLAELEIGAKPATPAAAVASKPEEAAKPQEPSKPAEADAGEPDTPERRLERNRLRVERASQNGEKNAKEVEGTAAAFDGIRDELVNNRIDTPELRTRLEDQIAEPLRLVAGKMFPELERRLQSLAGRLDGPEADLQPARQAAAEQADRVVVEMQRIRDRMLELESFNEAVDMLRAILDQQRKVTEETKKERTGKVRKLLED